MIHYSSRARSRGRKFFGIFLENLLFHCRASRDPERVVEFTALLDAVAMVNDARRARGDQLISAECEERQVHEHLCHDNGATLVSKTPNNTRSLVCISEGQQRRHKGAVSMRFRSAVILLFSSLFFRTSTRGT